MNRSISATGEKALRAHILETFGGELAAQPIAALVNTVDPDASRILMAPLSTDAGGWGQVKGWKNKEEAGYERMRALTMDAIVFLKCQDIAGTCGRGSKKGCLCKACWIREQTTRAPGPGRQ